MWNKFRNWFKAGSTNVINMTAEDFDGIADEMYKVIEWNLHDNHPAALEALEVIAEAYEDAASILRNA
jgi:hypothetical protein